MSTFTAPATLDAALVAVDSGAVPVAGGTDLVVGHRQGKRPLPADLVAIDRIAELATIDDGSGLTLGALASHDAIRRHATVLDRYTALADASAIVGSEATRSTGTIGGNVMNASPAADTVGPLICFDAVALLRSVNGHRRVPVAELALGPGRTVAAGNELLVALELGDPPAGSGSAYVRLEYRRHMEIAVVGAAALVALDGDTVTHCRIAVTAVAPTIRRLAVAEQALATVADIAAAAQAAAGDIDPISDLRGSASYRRAMTAVITRRAIATAIARARGESVPVPASDATFAQTGA